MNIFKWFRDSKLSGSGACLVASLLLTTGGVTVHAQTPPTSTPAVQSHAGNVALHVVAVDSAGNPIPDLTASDLKVFDNGSPQQIVSVRRNQPDRPVPLVVLFDLLNASTESRGASWNALKTAMAQVTPSGPLYLYLLVPDGSLYPVHALPEHSGPADASWMQNIGPLLDAAMQKVNQVKPLEIARASPVMGSVRFNSTFKALEKMGTLMTALRGPKQLLWITYGIPSEIQYFDHTWFYGEPPLRKLGAWFAQHDVSVYTADPGMNLTRGLLNRNALEILTGATGGRTFATIDMARAIDLARADARSTYSVEYQPAAPSQDGKYHKLRVESDRKGIRLQAESGYFATRPATPEGT